MPIYYGNTKLNLDDFQSIYVGNNQVYSKGPDIDYLYFVPDADGTIKFQPTGSPSYYLQYSFNKSSWTNYTLGTNVSVEANKPIYWKGRLDISRLTSSSNYITFQVGATISEISAYGDATSLLDFGNLKNYCFYKLFYGCSKLKTAPKLPSTEATGYCYYQMFYNCTSLVTPPDLPATSIQGYCYRQMFYGCTSLTTAPELPATTATGHCYYQMFYGCTSLVTAPELPATTLASTCYYQMFYGCTSLVNGPTILPATTLVINCYEEMFNRCSSLVNAPELPATNLVEEAYSSMFALCTSLVTAPDLPATTLQERCYEHMFSNCTSLVNAPTLPATTLAPWCYYMMFNRCTSLVKAPELPATTLADYCYFDLFNGCSKLNEIKLSYKGLFVYDYFVSWVSQVSSTGTLYYNGLDETRGSNAIPTGWTVVKEFEPPVVIDEVLSTMNFYDMTQNGNTLEVE